MPDIDGPDDRDGPDVPTNGVHRSHEAEADTEDRDDDDFWDDDAYEYRRRSGRRGAPAWLIPIGAVAALALVLGTVLITKHYCATNNKCVGSQSADKRGSTPGSGPASTGTSSPGPPPPSWPVEVVGQPSKVTKGPSATAAPGIYVWNDFSGWHLRRVSGPQVSAIRGTVTSTDKMRAGSLIGVTGGTLKVSDKSLIFDLPAGGDHVSGFDFYEGFYGATLIFDIRDAQRPLPTSLIHTGPSALTVISNPVAINKK